MGSVGKMFPNMQAKYISADGKELGPGEAGELWLSGPGFAPELPGKSIHPLDDSSHV